VIYGRGKMQFKYDKTAVVTGAALNRKGLGKPLVMWMARHGLV